MKNYKIDFSSQKPEELQKLNVAKGNYNIWRVYFDIKEHEEERKSETIKVTESKWVTERQVDPETGEEYTVEVEHKVEKEVLVESSLFESKFVEVRKHKSENPTALSIIKELVDQEIVDYDHSEEVNCFNLNGMKVWLDKDTRVGLMNSTMIQKNAGLMDTTLWLGTIPLTINCDQAIQMLGRLEIYALDCFNKTAEHRRNIGTLESVEQVANYDYTEGYPIKLNLMSEI